MPLSFNVALLAAALAVVPPLDRVEPPTPLEFQAIVNHFKVTTDVRPVRLHKQAVIFALGEAYRTGDHMESVIIVTEDPPRLAVSFLVSGGYGMNFVNEFFEASFFSRAESEGFYALLHGPQERASATFPRFAVEFTRVNTPEWHFISLTFGPPQKGAPTPLP